MTTRPYRHSIPAEILALSHERDLLRRRGQYQRADVLKRQIEDAGYVVKDNPHGAHLVILPSIKIDGDVYRTARQLPSFLNEPDTTLFSVILHAQNSSEQVRRCIESVVSFAGETDIEILLIDNASQDGLHLWVDALREREPRLRVVQITRPMGIAEAYNLGLKQSRGKYILLLDNCIELTGDIFAPLQKTLANEDVGITGLYGLRTDDLRHFVQSQEQQVEVVDRQCMAFKRELLARGGLFDERYRFPYYMDVDFNFAMRATGVQVVVTPDLPVRCHPTEQNASIADAERTRLTKRNFYRFLEKWGDRDDLLVDA